MNTARTVIYSTCYFYSFDRLRSDTWVMGWPSVSGPLIYRVSHSPYGFAITVFTRSQSICSVPSDCTQQTMRSKTLMLSNRSDPAHFRLRTFFFFVAVPVAHSSCLCLFMHWTLRFELSSSVSPRRHLSAQRSNNNCEKGADV